jgi:mannose/fructose/N-acetylgalactosamine-specific phosphotransferase system component IIC
MSQGAIAVAAVAAWGGVCAADQRALGARQFHQPIVAATAAGWILGAADRGLLVGLWLQLVWPVLLPLGGRILPDTGSAAVAAVLVATQIPGPTGLLAALLLGLLVARLTVPWEHALRDANERREQRALAQGGAGLGRAVALGVAGPFLRGALLAVLAFATARLAAPLLTSPDLAVLARPEAMQRGLIGGAACVGIVALLGHFRSEAGRTGVVWIACGALLGVAARALGFLGIP